MLMSSRLTSAPDSVHFRPLSGRFRRAFALAFRLLCLLGLMLFGGIPVSSADTARLLNLSARGMVGTGENALIGGFVIPSGESKSILIRAVGPTLGNFSVTNVLANPQITVYNSSGAAIASNDDWGSSLASTFSSVGAFALGSGSRDAALSVTLAPGAYTVIVTGVNSTSGIALVEMYETDSTNSLMNLSCRGQVGTGDSVLIAGFVIGTGSSPRKLLIRGVGPSLSQFSISNVLADPRITLYNASGTAIASNDNWGTPATTNDASAVTLSSAFSGAGAFSLPSGSADAALLATLTSGNYTVIVTGANSTTGVALAEIYDVTDLSISSTGTAPAITTQPSSATVNTGASVTFSVVASGTSPLTYQWYKSSSPISGATSASYTISSAATSDAGNYSVVVTNALGTATSSTATLTVNTTTSGSNAATVAAAAQTFLATLTSTQQSSVQLSWDLATARKCSNLPASMVARNGVSWGSLSATQKTAATTFISTALSATGLSLWQGMQAADDYLAANGGGTSTYGAGFYYIAFIGTPSATNFWVLQLTGHHLTYNISFNGAYKSGTPLFLGVEPKGSFTQSGTTYDPMLAQRTAVGDLVSSLTSYSSALLSGTYTDILFGANGTGGIDGTYPKSYPTGTTGRGILHTSLSSADQEKVKAVINSYVNTQASARPRPICSAPISATLRWLKRMLRTPAAATSPRATATSASMAREFGSNSPSNAVSSLAATSTITQSGATKWPTTAATSKTCPVRC
jgi:hypothetical protein